MHGIRADCTESAQQQTDETIDWHLCKTRILSINTNSSRDEIRNDSARDFPDKNTRKDSKSTQEAIGIFASLCHSNGVYSWPMLNDKDHLPFVITRSRSEYAQ